jgi:hypothetical protein
MMHEARAERHQDRIFSKPFVAERKLRTSAAAARQPLLKKALG